MGVDPQGDRPEPRRAVVDGVHARHHGEQHLRCADVGRRLLAPDVLLPGLQGQPVGRRPHGVDRDPDEAPGQGALESRAHAHVAGVRATEPHRHAEALGGPDGDVGAPLPGRCRQGQREEVGGCRDERPGVVGGRREGGQVVQGTVHRGVLHEDAEHLGTAGRGAQLVGGGHGGEVGDDDRDAQGCCAGAHHPEGLWEDLGVDEQHGVCRGLARTAHQGHRLGRGRRLVEQRGPGDRQAGQVADDGLEVEQRLEPALGDLGLVGRVGGVPGGVLEHVALHHGRGEGAVVAEPDHRGDPAVAGGHLTKLLEHGGLRRGRLDVERLRATDAARHGGVDEVCERAAADDLEHRGDVVLARADVAGRERGQVGGGGAHERLLKADDVDVSPSVTARRRAGCSRGACSVWSLAPERFRGGCPFGAPTRCVEVSPTRCERRAPIYHRPGTGRW